MLIKSAIFIESNEDYKKCPDHNLPEYAFIGRSNVGKSSLINMLTQRKNLAKTSGTPGKTLLINHFLINEKWYLVDLPGYGFAKQSKKIRQKLTKIVESYVLKRTKLTQLFILLDARHVPKNIDVEFINYVGKNGVPIALIITKSDKLKKHQLTQQIENLKQKLSETWEDLPPVFVTSAANHYGKDDLLSHIEQVNDDIKKNFK